MVINPSKTGITNTELVDKLRKTNVLTDGHSNKCPVKKWTWTHSIWLHRKGVDRMNINGIAKTDTAALLQLTKESPRFFFFA